MASTTIIVLLSLVAYAHSGLIASPVASYGSITSPLASYGSLASPLLAAPVAKAIAAVPEPYDPHPQYSFNYGVKDSLTGDAKEQSEIRDGDVVKGSYSLVEPDGNIRRVDYTADSINGFNAVVSRTGVAVAAKAVVAAPAVAKIATPITQLGLAAPALSLGPKLISPYGAPSLSLAPRPVLSSPYLTSSPLLGSSLVAQSSPYLASSPLLGSSLVAQSSPLLAPAVSSSSLTRISNSVLAPRLTAAPLLGAQLASPLLASSSIGYASPAIGLGGPLVSKALIG